jgi:endonuclease III
VSSDEDTARAVLDHYGSTYADAAGIALKDEPAPLFQLLVLAELLSARIGADIAVATAAELRASGWTTPQRMREAPRSGVIRALGRAGYRRYDERTATQLREMAQLVLDRYGGDLRRLAEGAGGDVGTAARLLQEVKGIGPTGAAVFLREVQAVWPWVRPYLDDRARAGARRVGLPEDAEQLAGLVAADRLAPFAAGLVRISLLPTRVDPLASDEPPGAASAKAVVE